MGRKTRKYTREFKQQAVALGEEIGYRDASQKLGIPFTTVWAWKNKVSANGGHAMSKMNEKVNYEDELKKAQKEIAELKKINIILKSAAAFFSQDHLK